jgi:hypothetical protein
MFLVEGPHRSVAQSYVPSRHIRQNLLHYLMLCLTLSAHRYYEKGYFALKPVSMSEDQKCMTVKFLWPLKGLRPMLECRDQGPGYARLINHETLDFIQSGGEICLETKDPANLPLPSWELLEMQ